MYSFFKRIFDIFFSLAVLLILFFPLIFIGLLIKTSSKGSIFYKWKVVGKDGLYFTGLKFRTMVTNADNLKESLKSSNEMEGPFFKMNNDPRVTSLGRILRKYSLDELPQFLSVLTGSMSVVGPRPPLQTEYINFSDFQKTKLQVKPGITCLWQVEGRNQISNPDDWVKKDLQYIKNRSFLLDIMIIYKTILTIFKGSGK
ncbi:sugar transferase [Candidatus Marinimicrobia bacterium]|nr:sugar transferase [Candidatus Neomarinimicrobiota bacterium]